jgi:hypothetical protein
MKKIAFFPGKFQPPHIGHVLTISKLLKKYHIILGISPDGPRVISQREVKDVFETIFDDRVQYFIFDGILSDYREIENFPHFDVILTGNDKIIKWAKKLNMPIKRIQRSKCIGGSGTELRKIYENR